ncbi:PQQ-binding-like beta-propeller repeat protein [Natrinema soli]|uniref:PQQ-binding-like beta-propeller repeat protein n=1 Tax=Natrinema soli TaxID=1930624 RepID=A0ABD5SJE7_9EURY|nr:PQQ-binding-like beta-propeller repeat protein [Natrinema soli]
MSNWQRRSFIASGATLAAGGVFASVGAGDETADESPTPVEETPGWSSYRGNAANSAYSATDSFPEPDTVAWTHDVTGNLAASNGRVFLRTSDDLRVLDAEDGTLEWQRRRFQEKDEEFNPTGTPAVSDGVVYVAGDQLTALDADDNSLIWEAEFETEPEMTSPAIAYGTVYVIADGELYAFNADTGDLEWKQETVGVDVQDPDQPPGNYVTREYEFQPIPVAIEDDRIYATTVGEKSEAFVVLDAHSGETHWVGMDRGVVYGGPIVVINDSVYTRYNYPDLTFSPDESLRTFRGIYEGPSPASTGDVTIGGGRYNISGDGWSHQPGGIDPYHNLQIAGETAIVYARPSFIENSITGFDIHDGSEKWAITDDTFDELSISETFTAGENGLYVQGDERLVAVRSSQQDGSSDDDSDDPGDNSDSNDSAGDDAGGSNGNSSDEMSGDESGSDGDSGSDDSGSGDQDNGSNNSTDRDDFNGDGQEQNQNSSQDDEGDISSDSVPGFTTGASVLSGALGLEWLRRRAPTTEPDE